MIGVLAGLVLLAGAAHATELKRRTGTVKGKAVDKESAKGISGVRVTLKGSKATTTSSSGTFSLTGLKPGTYAVVCAKKGYKTRKLAVSVSVGRAVSVTCRMTSTEEKVAAAKGGAP